MPDPSDEEIQKVLQRLLAEQDLPPAAPLLSEIMAKWGTRGFVAGMILGFAGMALTIFMDGSGVSGKFALAVAMMMGICAVPGALGGLVIGFAVWLFRRRQPRLKA